MIGPYEVQEKVGKVLRAILYPINCKRSIIWNYDLPGVVSVFHIAFNLQLLVSPHLKASSILCVRFTLQVCTAHELDLMRRDPVIDPLGSHQPHGERDAGGENIFEVIVSVHFS